MLLEEGLIPVQLEVPLMPLLVIRPDKPTSHFDSRVLDRYNAAIDPADEDCGHSGLALA